MENKTTAKARTIYSILPQLQSEAGHSYEYSLCVGKAAILCGWGHLPWIPKNCSIQSLPSNWSKNLSAPQERFACWRNLLHYWTAIRNTAKTSLPIFFLENMNFTQTVIFCCALFLTGRHAQLWVVHRYALHQMWKQGKWHAVLFKFMGWYLGAKNLSFFTDSELLIHQHTTLLSKKIQLLPIPHAIVTVQERFEKAQGIIDCWWPGGSIRKEKGIAEIQRLSLLLQNKKYPIRLIVAKKAQDSGIIASSSILYIDNHLDRRTYEKWMRTADLVLLPYDPLVYSAGTSGIFCEAVSAGTIPVVRDGTWSAYELRKHGLGELILDWENSDLPKQLLALHQNVQIRKNLDTMRQVYQQFHCLAHFAEILRHS